MKVERLTAFVYSEGAKYRFTLESEMRVRFPGRRFGVHSFRDGQGIERMRMDCDIITVREGYSWDGSSPKFRLFGIWMGTPDFEGTRLGSMVHDTLYQFLHLTCFPLKRQECDVIFGEVMASVKFPLWWVYSGAVWTFGGIHHGVGSLLGGKRVGSCEVLTGSFTGPSVLACHCGGLAPRETGYRCLRCEEIVIAGVKSL